MQKFLDYISSKSFRNAFCFVMFTVLMTAAISSQNFFFQKVVENGISKRDIIAQKDIKVIDISKVSAVADYFTYSDQDKFCNSWRACEDSSHWPGKPNDIWGWRSIGGI